MLCENGEEGGGVNVAEWITLIGLCIVIPEWIAFAAWQIWKRK